MTAIAPEPAPLSRRQHLLLLLVVALALGLRLAHLAGQYSHNPYCTNPMMDEAKHHEWATQIADGEGFDKRPYFRAPLYYYLLAGVYAAAGQNIVFGRIFGCLLGAASCYLIARLGIMLSGFRVGFVAGLIAACYWPLIHFDNQLLTVGLEVFLDTLLLITLLWAAEQRIDWPLLIAGVVWGLAALARPNVLALAPGILAWLWFALPRSTRPWQRLLAFGLVLAGAALVILPVTLRNRIVGGQWVLIASQGGVNLYIGNNPEADGYSVYVPGVRPDSDSWLYDVIAIAERDTGRPMTEAEVSQYYVNRTLQWIDEDPGAWLRLMLRKTRIFFSATEVPNNQPIWFFVRLSPTAFLYWLGFPIVATLGLAGLTLIRTGWRKWSLPVICLVIYLATVVAFFCPARYRLPVIPVLILTAAAGLLAIPALLRERRWWTLVPYGVVLVLAAVFIATNPPDRARLHADSEGMGHFHLGLHHAHLSQIDPSANAAAVAHFRQAIAYRPSDPGPRRSLARALARDEDWTAAAEAYAQALQLMPQDSQLHYGYGLCLEQLGQLDAAAEQLTAAIAIHRGWYPPFGALVRIRLQQQRPDEAVKMLRLYVSGVPYDYRAQHQLGLILARLQRYDEAAAAFTAAVQAWPTFWTCYLDLASAQQALGDLAAARATLEHAVTEARKRQDNDAVRQFDERLRQLPRP